MADVSKNIKENIDGLFQKLQDFIKSQTVIGEPIVMGETTLVPLISASFGLGSGSGDGETSKGEKGMGAGAGIGAKITPLAVLVIKDSKTELITLKNSQALEKLIDKIPELVSKVNNLKSTKKEKQSDDLETTKK
ncbi:MAG: spore germination protein GerW family protein [Clostridiales bacterium]